MMEKEEEAPFGKVTLSKLLVLKDKDTREDYFAQQAAFVTLEGRKDVRAVGFGCGIILFPPSFVFSETQQRDDNVVRIPATTNRIYIYVIPFLHRSSPPPSRSTDSVRSYSPCGPCVAFAVPGGPSPPPPSSDSTCTYSSPSSVCPFRIGYGLRGTATRYA